VSSASVSNFRKAHTICYPWIVISLCALFLVYKYVLQVYPSVITNDLMREFHLDGVGIGNLGATFFYSYLIVQLFAGPLLDKLGARFLVAVAILTCAVGAIGFSRADTLVDVLLFRALMGAGAAFATIGYLKIGAAWFDQKRYAFVSGFVATAAMMGSMAGQLPFAIAVEHIGWQHSLLYCGIFGAIFAVVFYLVVRSDPQHMQTESSPMELRNIRFKDIVALLKLPWNWWLMCYAGFAFSPLAVFCGLWGDAFLQSVYHVSKANAATLTSMSFLGLAIGAPILGYVSDRLSNRISVMWFGLSLAFVGLLGALYLPVQSHWVVGTLLFIFGFGTGAYLLIFPLGKELNVIGMVATVLAFINTGDAVIGTFTEPLLGKLLDHFRQGAMRHGIPYFSSYDYHLSMIVLPIYLLIAFAFLYLVKKAIK